MLNFRVTMTTAFFFYCTNKKQRLVQWLFPFSITYSFTQWPFASQQKLIFNSQNWHINLFNLHICETNPLSVRFCYEFWMNNFISTLNLVSLFLKLNLNKIFFVESKYIDVLVENQYFAKADTFSTVSTAKICYFFTYFFSHKQRFR